MTEGVNDDHTVPEALPFGKQLPKVKSPVPTSSRLSLATQPCTDDCPVARAARVLDGKWTTLIVRELLQGPRGFAALLRGVGTVSPRLLTARLRLLEDEGVLTRTVFDTKPPTTEYALTPHGLQLQTVIQALADFGSLAQQRDRQAHVARQRSATPSATPGRRVHRLR